MKKEIFLSERLILMTENYKYTFLKTYGEGYRKFIDVVRQNIHTGYVDVEKMGMEQISQNFEGFESQIFGYLNKPIPTFNLK